MIQDSGTGGATRHQSGTPMDLFALAAATFALAATLLHVLTVLIAAARFNRPSSAACPAADLPPVTIIRPLCGIDVL